MLQEERCYRAAPGPQRPTRSTTVHSNLRRLPRGSCFEEAVQDLDHAIDPVCGRAVDGIEKHRTPSR